MNEFFQELVELDKQLFLFLNSFHTTYLDYLMYWITAQNPFYWSPLYLLLVILIFRKFKFQKTLLAISIIGTIVLSCDQFSSFLIKPWVARLRPCHEINLQDIIHTIQGCGGRGLYGFISSHAANCFALAMFCFLLLRRYYTYTYLLFYWATMVSYSRIYVGVHYPGDIVAGALCGTLFGIIFYQVYAWSEKKYFN